MRATGAHAALSTSAALPRLWGYGSVYKVWQIATAAHLPGHACASRSPRAASNPWPAGSATARRTGLEKPPKTTHGSTTVPLSAVGRLLARYTPVAGTFRRGEEDGDGGYRQPGLGLLPPRTRALEATFLSRLSRVVEKIKICACGL